MKNPTKALMATFAVALLACSVFTQQAQAIPISGGISLAGTYRTDTGDINTAKSFTSFSGVFVTSVAGSYSTVSPGQSVTQNGFTFNPFSGPVIPLWTFMSGGRTYSFDLTALTGRDQPGDNTLTLRGFGTLHISGTGPTYDDTVGTWVFTANQGGGTFSFSSSNSAIPEGGSALALLGLGLVAVEALRRKLATA
ncbi:MAG: hypothetical protein ACR2HH_07800 [Chthoniobacterales bacterium]